MSDNTTLNPGVGGDTYASDDIGGIKHQRVKLIHGVDGINDGDVSRSNPLPVSLHHATRSDTFTGAGSGATIDVSTRAVSAFAIQVTGTGATPTAWNVVLEASLDGVTFTTVVTATQADGDGKTRWTGAIRFPALYFRSRCVSLTLGSATNIVVTILGMP
jgi:hypothetical protein